MTCLFFLFALLDFFNFNFILPNYLLPDFKISPLITIYFTMSNSLLISLITIRPMSRLVHMSCSRATTPPAPKCAWPARKASPPAQTRTWPQSISPNRSHTPPPRGPPPPKPGAVPAGRFRGRAATGGGVRGFGAHTRGRQLNPPHPPSRSPCKTNTT